MAGLFNLAADRALHMSQPRPPKISIAIGIGQPLMGMAGGGGLSSVQKKMNIGGQPHKLAYINSDEASLLKQMGGLGEPVEGTRGVPAYFGVGYSDEDAGYSESDMTSDDEESDADWWTDDSSYRGTGEWGVVSDPEAAVGRGYALGIGGLPAVKEVEQEWYDKFVTWVKGIPAELKAALPDFIKEQTFEVAGEAALMALVAAGIPFTAAAAIVGITPYVAGKLGVQTKEEQLQSLKDKYGVNSPEYKTIDKLNQDYAEAEAYMDKLHAEQSEPIDILKEEDIDEAAATGEEEEEKGRWDDWYGRPPTDPYKGFEDRLEEIYGPDWREILERGVS